MHTRAGARTHIPQELVRPDSWALRPSVVWGLDPRGSSLAGRALQGPPLRSQVLAARPQAPWGSTARVARARSLRFDTELYGFTPELTGRACLESGS